VATWLPLPFRLQSEVINGQQSHINNVSRWPRPGQLGYNGRTGCRPFRSGTVLQATARWIGIPIPDETKGRVA